MATADTAAVTDTTAYPTLHFYTLRNGIRMAVARDPGVPLATVLLAVRGGRASQLQPFNGVPVLLHDLLVRPDPEVATNRALFDEARSLGMQYTGALAAEHMHFAVTLQQEKLAQGIRFLATSLNNPRFSELEIQRKASQLAAKGAAQELKPTYFLQEEVLRHLWAPYPESKSPQLDYASARAATPTYLKVYVERFFKPHNMLLVVGGDVDTNACVALGDSLFRDWPTDNEPLPPPADYQPLEADSAWLAINERANAPIVQVGWQLPGSDEVPAITARGRMLALLMDTPGGRLDGKLVQRGYALRVAARFEAGRNKSQLTLTVVPNPFYLRQCLDTLRKELDNLGDANFFKLQDTDNALQVLDAERVYERDNNAGLCQTLAGWWALGGLGAYAGFTDSLRHTAPREVNHWAEQYLKLQPYTAGVLISSEMATSLRMEQYVRTWNHPPLPDITLSSVGVSREDSLKLAAVGREPQLLEDSEEYFGKLMYKPDKVLGRFTVFFNLGKQEIDSASVVKLRGLADYLKKNPTLKLFADGHTDRSGSTPFNYKLSLSRAAQVRTLLIRKMGVAPGQVSIRGFGEKKLLYDDPDPTIDALNRRVEFTRDEK